jgi:glycosyltransferase involved in cell wall biosynthesis
MGIALIAKNEAENLRRLLPVLKQYFDQVVVVDTNSEDDTGKVAQEFGCDVYLYEGPYITVRYFDPEKKGYVEFQNVASFGDARTFAFSKLKTTWQAWCDCDDHWVNLDKVRALLQEIEAKNAPINAIWTIYDYDQVQLGEKERTIAEHRRERFVRAGTGWHWTRPVHEHMITNAPISIAEDTIRVVHKRDKGRDLARNARNIQILRNELRKNKKDARSWFDLATQYYNARILWRSLMCHRKFIALADNDVEKYQAWHHAADCWRILGQIERAIICDKQALVIHPDWADAHYGLAECAFALGDFGLCLRHVRMGAQCDKPNDFLVLNPMDYEWAPLVLEQRALGATGHVQEALDIVDRILEIIPDDQEALYAKKAYIQVLADAELQASTLKVAERLDDVSKVYLFNGLPGNIRQQRVVRDTLLTGIINLKRNPDVVIFCGATLESWGPPSPNSTGIGGSETAVVNVVKCLSDQGVNVDVYNQCGPFEGKYGNARYLDMTRYNGSDTPRLSIAWRNPNVGPFLKGDHRWLWVHDLHMGPNLTPDHFRSFTAIRPVSNYHGWFLERAYPFLKGKILPTRNGIDLSRFDGPPVERHPHRAIYCSSPDRGLVHLLLMWPMVRRYVPDAELHIFYGWETFDRSIQQTGNRDLLTMKSAILGLLEQNKDQGVVHRGRVSQSQLATEMRSSAVLAYPTQFLEVSCITAMEAMASGTVVLSTIAGALPETVSSGGLLVRGFPTSDAYQSVFTKDLIALMTKADAWDTWSKRGLSRAQDFTWEGVANEWLERIA